MAPSNPNLIGQIALQEGYITAEQLEACLRAQDGKPLGTVLVERGALSQEKLDEIIRIQQSVFQAISADPLRGGLFGQIARRLGYVNEGQLSEALREQERDGRQGSALRLGQILMKMKVLEPEQFLDVLRRQQKEVVRCPRCEAFYDAPAADRLVCPACQTVVHKPAG